MLASPTCKPFPFATLSSTAPLAAWMLYHVREVDRALAELARVLRPGGRLVAVTNSPEHLGELYDLVEKKRLKASFDGDNGAELLRGHFSSVERRDAYGWVAFPDRNAAQSYVDASPQVLAGGKLPEFEGPLRVAACARRLRGGQGVIRPAELIERKRDGGQLTPEEIDELVLGHASGEIPDYQLAAFCMAVYFRGLSAEETLALTNAFVRSGSTLDLRSELGRTVVDKHSTGGVGDKTSLVVGPLVAACGVPFGKMSGRGLGHTGGTLDKLESISGFRVELSNEEFVEQVREIGLAIIGQSPDLVPADKRLYALRDVTGTVDSIPLIAASIMSKKIAAGAEGIVLDVKVGNGAFMKSLADARMLAESMQELGHGAGRKVVALLTDMDQPLGWAIGNAIEIEEVRALLAGEETPPDLFSLAIQAVGQLLALSDLGIDAVEGTRRAERAVDDGSAAEMFERWIAAQGGDLSAGLPKAPVTRELTADRDGFVGEVSALGLGRAGTRARRRAPHDGRRDRPRGRDPLLRQAGRSDRGRPDSRRRLRTGRGERGAGPRSDQDAGRDRGRAPASTPDRARDPDVAPVRWLRSGRARATGSRDDPGRPRAASRRPDVCARRDRRPTPDPAPRPCRDRGRADRRDRRGARAARQVFGCSVRERSSSPDSPPDDGEPAALAGWNRDRRSLPQSRCQI